LLHVASSAGRNRRFERHSRETAPTAAYWTRHRSRPAYGRSQAGAQFREWHTRCQTDCGDRALDASNRFQQLPDPTRTHRNDQQVRLIHSTAKIMLNHHVVLSLKVFELLSMSIMHDNLLLVSRRTQSGDKRGGNPSSTQKNRCFCAGAFHVSAAHAWSAASISA